ncbi:hypothetical protein COX05_00815 [candidate division WWE3 bacterium CG22_combo_CG10-13_8_21_14_all_39_12]|uniref:EamA domain-containing protein n=2 Tax=Katanobacteria TaxID=422282 RepID=A0A2M7X4S1_UNCKA|nr:MAG: hypothetical protein COX05_00815 [candidate division WWE3 bacterium CG22_combo_CG10-13_8_21_14_all_39_12]PJA41166.1 MAG: hypothetical protein CO179_00470 [candidate division WWE3 bacterium CG_4_9_14_3_um_filter_39_7]
MSWLLLSIGATLFFTSLNLLQRVLATDAKHPRAMGIVFNLYAMFIAITIFFVMGAFQNFELPSAPVAWAALIAASFCYAMFERGRFLAAQLLDASVFTTISQVAVVVAFAGALFIYNETLSVEKIVGSLLILVALLLVSYSKSIGISSKKGILVATVISIMLGLGWMLDKFGTTHFNPETYSVLVWTIPIIFVYLPYVKTSEIVTEFKRTSWKIVVLAAINVIGYLLQLKALGLAEATRVIPIIQISTLLTVLLGIILLKERDNLTKKIFAGILAVIGAYLLI